jgi:hypothetical protein
MILPANPPKLLDQAQSVLRTKHYSIRTERVYLDWIKRYILFHDNPAGSLAECGDYYSGLIFVHVAALISGISIVE